MVWMNTELKISCHKRYCLSTAVKRLIMIFISFGCIRKAFSPGYILAVAAISQSSMILNIDEHLLPQVDAMMSSLKLCV